jgi:DNA replication protein DnaC
MSKVLERGVAQMGRLDLIDLLPEQRLRLREGRRFRDALKRSGLPYHKTLDEFDFGFPSGIDARKLGSLAELRFIPAGSNVVLLGPAGVRKTMVAVGLGVAAYKSGFSIYFSTLDHLVGRLRTATAAGRFNRQLQAYLRPSVLIIDDLGYRPLSRAEATMMCQLVSCRCESGPMIVISRTRFSEWGRVLGDDVLARTILERLLDHCDVLNISGPDYRRSGPA